MKAQKRKANRMKTDIKGCSTCAKGQEQVESFTANGREYVQYDYRHTTGDLFSCVAPDLERARLRRDKWIEVKRKTWSGCDPAMVNVVDPYNRL